MGELFFGCFVAFAVGDDVGGAAVGVVLGVFCFLVEGGGCLFAFVDEFGGDLLVEEFVFDDEVLLAGGAVVVCEHLWVGAWL